MKILIKPEKQAQIKIHIPMEKKAGLGLLGALSLGAGGAAYLGGSILNLLSTGARTAGEVGGEVIGQAIPALAEVGPSVAVGLPFAIPPALAAGAGATSTITGEPGPKDFQRVRKRELATVLNRLAAQAEQRARQMRGKQD